jgi:aminocarboxymuconate-semialdehyde decarboxylase
MEKNNQKKSDKSFSRRDFIGTVGASAMGIAFGSLDVSHASDTGNAITSNTNAKFIKDENSVKYVTTKIIDIHRHCMEKPEGIMGMMSEMLIHREENEQYAVATVDGISSIMYPELMDINIQIRGQNEAGVTKGILSSSMPLESAARSLFLIPEDKITRTLNDAAHAMVARYPDKLAFMATVNPFNKSCIKECERCLDTLSAKGINISTSWGGKYLDHPELDYFWEFVQKKDVVIFLHPPFVPIGHEYMAAYKLEEMIGRGFDTTMTVVRMIYSGVFDRYPKLKIILPHMGGGLPMFAGRLDFGYRLGYKGLPQDQIPVCKRKPTDYFRTNLYVDTMGFNPLGIKHVIDLFGADRILFGSDYAAVPINPREQVDIVKSLDLSFEDEEKILWKNAERLFNII